MKKKIFPIVIMVLLAAAGLSNGQQETGPKIAVNEMRYDAGRVPQGKPVSHVFEISNAGAGTLVIERIQPT